MGKIMAGLDDYELDSDLLNKLLVEEWRCFRPHCFHCGKKTTFARQPAQIPTAIGHRKRLSGKCAVCGKRVSHFMAGDSSEAGSVKIGKPVLSETKRASVLLGCSMRSLLEVLVSEHLEDFVGHQLAEFERAGLITRGEREQREAQMQQPIEEWQRRPPEPKQDNPGRERGPLESFGAWLDGLLS